jgi:FkbM family methyltransferase
VNNLPWPEKGALISRQKHGNNQVPLKQEPSVEHESLGSVDKVRAGGVSLLQDQGEAQQGSKNMMTATKLRFFQALSGKVLKSLGNYYGSDNWDKARFGRRMNRSTWVEGLLHPLRRVLRSLGYSMVAAKNVSDEYSSMMDVYGEGLSNTYDLLEDDYSRRALIEVLAFRLLGYRHVKLWTNTSWYWSQRTRAAALPTEGPEIESGIDAIHLAKTDLRPVGFPLTLITRPSAITHQFLVTQYAYQRSNPPVWLSKGEYVIDGGAGWGDTALRFAHEVGEEGRVYSFEFEPHNVEILERNLAMNGPLASPITVVQKALWRDSSMTLGFTSQGPASRIIEGGDQVIPSISIDDFSASLPRVDFIKMDIEGAELPALQGAEKCLRRFRPKLAISLYHKLSDFVEIPAYLASLGLNYAFYIDHVTIHSEETVLFAAPR